MRMHPFFMAFIASSSSFFLGKVEKIWKKFGGIKKSAYLCNRLQEVRALSSVGLEHLPYKQRVGGSNPSAPTGVFSSQSFMGAGNCFLFIRHVE